MLYSHLCLKMLKLQGIASVVAACAMHISLCYKNSAHLFLSLLSTFGRSLSAALLAMHVQGFREWFLETLGIPAASRAGQPVRVTLISRKPYGKKKRVARQIRNEDELFAMVQQMQGVQARMVDLAQIGLAEQIQLVSSGTEVLIGTRP